MKRNRMQERKRRQRRARIRAIAIVLMLIAIVAIVMTFGSITDSRIAESNRTIERIDQKIAEYERTH